MLEKPERRPSTWPNFVEIDQIFSYCESCLMSLTKGPPQKALSYQQRIFTQFAEELSDRLRVEGDR